MDGAGKQGVGAAVITQGACLKKGMAEQQLQGLLATREIALVPARSTSASFAQWLINLLQGLRDLLWLCQTFIAGKQLEEARCSQTLAMGQSLGAKDYF